MKSQAPTQPPQSFRKRINKASYLLLTALSSQPLLADFIIWNEAPSQSKEYWSATTIDEACSEALRGINGEIQNGEGLLQSGACVGYLRGLIDGIELAKQSDNHKLTNGCIPKNISDEELINQTIGEHSGKSLEKKLYQPTNHPTKHLDRSSGMIFIHRLRLAFPCH